MKTHYPVEYMASLFTSGAGKPNFIEVKKLVEDCNVNNIPVIAPNLNHSYGTSRAMDATQVLAGLDLVKGLGSMADKIVESRPDDGFKNSQEAIEYLISIGCSTGHIRGLIKAGVLDDFGDRDQLLADYEYILPQYKQYLKNENNQYSLIDEKFVLPMHSEETLKVDETVEHLGVYVHEQK